MSRKLQERVLIFHRERMRWDETALLECRAEEDNLGRGLIVKVECQPEGRVKALEGRG